MFNEAESTLRYWEKEFPDVIKPRRNARSTRFYDSKDIDSVGLIYHLLRERKLTLDGTRQVLRSNKGKAEKQAKLMRRLKNVRKELKSLAKAFAEADKIKGVNYGHE